MRYGIIIFMACLLTCGRNNLSDATPLDCVDQNHCNNDDVCFFGRCVAPGFSLSKVYVETIPSNQSNLLPQTDAGSPRSLTQGHTISLLDTQTIATSVTTPMGTALLGTITTQRIQPVGAISLPTDTAPMNASISAAGTSLRLLPGNHRLNFIASKSNIDRPPLTIPMMSTQLATWPLIYPTDTDFDTVSGKVVNNTTTAAPQSGVFVWANALVDGNNIDSSQTISDASGSFTVSFFPGVIAQATSVTMHIGPGPTNLWVPTATKQLVTPGEQLPTLSMDIDANPQVVDVRILNNAGAPISDATVTFKGAAVGAGTFEASGNTNTLGRVAVTLLPGVYDVVAAPLTTHPEAMAVTTLCVPPAKGMCTTTTALTFDQSILDIEVPNKVQITGILYSHRGDPVAQARIVFTWSGAPVVRTFSGVTGPLGQFNVFVDPGTTQNINYELIVEPEQQALVPLPRHRQLLSVGKRSITGHNITLYEAVLFHGSVVDPKGVPVVGARIRTYSIALGTAEPMLVGLGQTDAGGAFVVALPSL